MIEHELAELADRVAPAELADLPDLVLARIDAHSGADRSPTRVRALVAAGLATLVAASFLLPQVRAFAAELLGVAGIEISTDTPDAPPQPRAPLPESRSTSVADARAAVDFPIRVPARLGSPDEVTVADDGRVVSMSWMDPGVLLDQFDGSLGPVFAKQVEATRPVAATVRGSDAWWIGSAHDLTYIDRDGHEITETARLAGKSLVWEAEGVTFRLEGERLDVAGATAIARSLR